jgi:3-deoxy-D-manno-octulosonic-acid transferase
LNGRITPKSFVRWKFISSFSKKIFGNFDLCLVSNKKSKKYLNELGAQNIKYLGNLKFTQSENDRLLLKNNFKKFILSKKTWCASSTHNGEEQICGLVHKQLKNKYNDLLTIIIPRHVDRVDGIKNNLNKLNLKTYIYGSNDELQKDTDILIINAYGKTKTFYNLCKNVFLGGSLVNHGGQNPLEATRYGCSILHGPNTQNFSEIYKFLRKNKISKKINSQKDIVYNLNKLFSKKPNSKKIQKKLKLIGNKILENTYKEVKLILR